MSVVACGLCGREENFKQMVGAVRIPVEEYDEPLYAFACFRCSLDIIKERHPDAWASLVRQFVGLAEDMRDEYASADPERTLEILQALAAAGADVDLLDTVSERLRGMLEEHESGEPDDERN